MERAQVRAGGWGGGWSLERGAKTRTSQTGAEGRGRTGEALGSCEASFILELGGKASRAKAGMMRERKRGQRYSRWR